MPNYDQQVEEIVRTYKRAVTEILAELERFDITDYSRANAQATLKSIADILTSLNEESAKWVAENIPLAVRTGVAEAIVALGVVSTLAEAQQIVKFNRVNKALVEAVIADTQADLLAVTQNVDRKVKATIRQVVSEAMRNNLAKGVNGRRTINYDTLEGLRKKLGNAVNTGIIDAAGRRWKPEVYVDTVTRTKMMRTTIEASSNEAASRGAYYGVISSHGAKDACRDWEGRIVKLVESAPGDYPYIGSLLGSRDIFHPRCKHTVSPIRNPDRY
ncbi:phage minor capsid protein [Fictibacillus sp. Mic-4]|uniref:phage minor capsid protein n=1 Tax=Fictibacillus sp. Mic-4 TaxID=3132826 RepID=UPI003CFB37C2